MLVTVGVWLIVTVKLFAVPTHPLNVGVTVTVHVIGALVLFAGAVQGAS